LGGVASHSQHVVFDSYFTNAPICNAIEAHERAYVGDLKCNRKVWFRGVEMRADALAAEIPAASRKKVKVNGRLQWYFTKKIWLPQYTHAVRIVVLWPYNNSTEPGKILITNQTHWEITRVLRGYGQRWTGTETLHRDGKQHYSGRTSLGLEYFLWEKDEEWTWPDERLIELGIKECARIGLIEPSEVQDGTVVRMKKAYPVYDGNYHESLALLQQYIESFENLQTVGRNGLHRYNNQDHSMLTGVYAARNIAGEKNDVWSVNTEMEYHEEVRGEKAEFAAEKNTALGDRLVPARVSVSVPAAASAADDLESRLSESLLDAAFAKIDPLSMGISVGAVIGFGLFLATAILLFKEGELVGPNLSLLANYLPGFSATWPGAFVGMVEAGITGFLLGVIAAWLRNYGLEAYASMLKRRAEAESRRELLDKI
jgi:hypothetical protein